LTTNRSWRIRSARLARLLDWQPHFVGSLQQLELAMHAQGRPALEEI